MSALRQFFSSSVGTKVLIALTGLGFAGFLVTHLAANLLVLVDAEAYNGYSHKLIANPLIYLAEAGLVVLFVTHVFKAISNYVAQPRGASEPRYDAEEAGRAHAAARRLASTTMIVTGTWLLVFIVIHLKTFKFGPWYETRNRHPRPRAARERRVPAAALRRVLRPEHGGRRPAPASRPVERFSVAGHRSSAIHADSSSRPASSWRS